MKRAALLCLWVCGLGLLGCGPSGVQPVPDVHIALSEVALDRDQGLFMHDGEPFSGFASASHDTGVIAERAGFLDGRRHGAWLRWAADGTLRQETPYVSGRIHGTTRTWFRDGALRTEGTMVRGVAHGVQRQWYASGALFKELRLVEGVEQGMQRAWRENGAIFNNYEAREGRIFGLRRSKLCFGLSDEEVVLATQ